MSKQPIDRRLLLKGAASFDVAMVRADLAIREPDIDAALLRTDTQATAVKLRGTPALVIGGSLYRRGMPVSELRQAVAKARSA